MKWDPGVMKVNTISKLLIGLCYLLFICADLNAQNWHLQTPINTFDTFFRGVYFTSDQTGYAVGEGGAIYKTIDGGLAWSAQNSSTTNELYDVFFKNNNTGYAVGANGTIRKTSNAGTLWASRVSGTTNQLNEVHFPTVNFGYAVGAGGTIRKTTDGGETWAVISSGTTADIQAVYFTSALEGYFVGNGGLVKKTVDGGSNWSSQTLGIGDNLNDIYFVDASTGFTVGYNGQIWKTTDAGINWIALNSTVTTELRTVHFTDLVNGYVTFGGSVLTTSNGGTDWAYSTLSAYQLEGLHFPSANAGYSVGGGGTLLKYQSELEPEYHPSDLTFTEVFATSMRVSFTGSPDIPTGYLVLRKAGSSSTAIPLDGIEFTLNQTLGDGSTVVYIGNSTSFSQTGLTAGTEYFYTLYSYNGIGTAINYKTDSPLVGSQSTYLSGTPWTEINNLTWYPRSVHFFDANNGGHSGTYVLGTTNNGGQVWTDGTANGDFYTGIFYASSTTAFVIGYNGSNRVIRRTVNGGTTWVDQVRTTSTYSLYDVWFTSPTTGYAVGSVGNILKTINGTSWTPVTSGTSSDLNGVSFANSSNGIAVGQDATIRKTQDGGTNWTGPMYAIPTTAHLNDVSFVNVNTAYAVGAGGTIIKFDGVNWTLQNSGTTNDLNGVHFIDANIGYAVGMAETILKTINGGADWYPFPTATGTGHDLYDVHFPTSHTGYAVGNEGANARIFKFQSVPEPTVQPTGLAFSSISSSGLTISFSPASGSPDGYIAIRKIGSAPTSIPLDGNAYAIGATLGDGVVAYVGSSTSFIETTLTPGTDYYYSVYSYNSSGDVASTNYQPASPLSGNSVTTLLPTVANNASVISTTGFTANWSAITGASSYKLDVSADGFVSFVSGYNNLTVSGITSNITGLTPGTSYSYRVRAINVSGASSNSNVINTITIPSAPASSAATLVTTTSFTANWVASVGAAGYRLDVSTAANNFSPNIIGYDNLSVTGLSTAISGLTPGTLYRYRVRAENASGTSVNSSTISPITLCSAPTANAASSITAVSFTANWTAVTGAVDYRIDVSTDPSFSFIVGSYNNQTVTGTSLAVSGLGAGTNYYYRVRASNASGSSANSGPISVLTLPAAPLANDAISITATTFIANWNSVSTATGYFIDVSTVNTFASFVAGYNNTSVGSTSIPVTVPTAGITYYYRVRAINTTGASSNSNTITTLLKPAVPVATAATVVTAVSFTANWGSASGATEYNLEVSSDNFVSNIPGYDNLSLTGTTVSVTSLIEGTTYKYRVRAVNALWSSANSNVITIVTTPPAPVAINAIPVSTTGFTAKWNATAGASSYQLDVSLDNFSSFISGFNNASVTGTSAVLTGLTAGTTYQYRLRALNASGTSGNSNTISTSTLSVAPTASASSSISSSGFTASWTSVTGANDYRIDVSTSIGFGSYVGSYNNQTVGGTSLTVSGLVAGTTYYYRVRASNASGASANSNIITTLINPAAPIATAATAVTVSGFTANWNTVTGSSGYKLDVSLNDFVSNVIGYSDLSVASTSQSITGLVAGTTYKFRVRSLNATGASDNSNIIATVTAPSASVATSATSVTTTGFTANWNIVTGAPAYFLDVSTDNLFGSFISGYNNFSTSSLSQTISGLTAGTIYYYRVRAANVSGSSVNSPTITVATLPVTPASNAATIVTSTGFTANWTTVAGAVDYRIDVSTDNAFSSFVGSSNQTVSGTSLSISGLLPGTNYYYRVRAANASGSSASSITIAVLTLPAAPVANDAVSITSTTFSASWNSVSTATGYFIDVSSVSNFTSFVSGYNNASVASTSTTVTLPTSGTTYYYRVRAISTAGTSSNSNVITTLLKPASTVASIATAVAADGFTANWSTVPGVLGYYLDVSSNNFSSFLPGFDNFPLSGISQVITGLSAGISYQYRVRSYNITGSSANSSTITTITIPPAPVAISASSFTATSFTANWQATTGASSYMLDVSSDPAFGSFFSGFENLSVAGTLSNVSGLTPGVAYYYQVRAVNVSGTSPNSNTISSTNIPPPPPVLSATSITTTSFTANWSTTSGALSYLLDVSDNNFSSFVSGYEDLNVSGNSQSVTGLVAGTAYQYRVRATNASGTSSNSSTISTQTLPAEPNAQATAMNFSAITTSTMNVSFAAAGGAIGYIVIRKTASSPTGLPSDGVTYSSGSSLGDGTVAYVGSATNFSESSLSSGIVYFYDVYAYNGTGIFTNYNTSSPLEGSKVTLPDAPVSLAATLIGQTSFTANWILANGATGYFIDVSTDDFSTFITGYNSQPTGNVVSFIVSSLTAATTYQYRVRAVNAAGSSINSNSISILSIPPTPTALTATGPGTTSFTSNWNGTGTTNFFIDVSSDNFSTFVTGYNNLAVSGATSQNITGLNIGLTYQYRIRSSNASGVSPSSNAIAVNTLMPDPTAQPTALIFSNVTINSIDLSFVQALGSPTGYLVLRKLGSAPIDVPVDGIVYPVGGSVGSSTIVHVGGTSFSEISLSNEVNYFYAIYSYNGAGASINYLITSPLQGNASTLAVEPASQPTLFNFVSSAASLYSVSFTPASASGYLVLRKQGSAPVEIPIDGVPYAVGGTLGSSTVAHFAGASLFDESVLSNSTYFYSIFSFNGLGASVNYRVVNPLTASVLTLPDAPVAKPSSNNTTTTFDANWDAVSGTETVTYEVEISKDDFSTIEQSLPLISATTVRINNLSPSTDYQYRIRANNASGISTNSTAIAARTSDVSLANALKINTNPTSVTLAVGFNQTTLSVNVSGGTGTRSVVLKYRAILDGAYTTIAAVDKGSDNFETVIAESMVDELGLEFYFEAIDQTGTVVKSNGNSFIYLSKSAAAIEAIPFISDFDGSSGTYEMFSVPYVLTDKNISGIFDELGAPDKTQWRLFHFKGNKYIEYPDNITTLEMGKGYWFNSKEKIDIKPGAGELSKANQSTPFQITFEKGWNQIGNPYPFNIDWNVITDANQTIGLNSLWLFEKGAYAKKDVLATWKGAFVFSDNGGTVNFPVSAKTAAPGRTKTNDLSPKIDEEAWQLPILLSLNGMVQISSIGMHPDAKTSKDKFDEITMPRFIDYLEMDTYHEEFFAPNFSSDIVPTTNTSSWLFTVSSNQKGTEATINWDQQALFDSRAKLALLDLQTQTLVDMKTTSSYRFSWTEGRQFKILYSKEGELLPGITLLGNAYPNPFNTAVTIPFMLEQDQSNVEVVVYDMLGRKVKAISRADVKAGIHNLEWSGENEQGDEVERGMYFYQLLGDKGTLSSIKRLLKQ